MGKPPIKFLTSQQKKSDRMKRSWLLSHLGWWKAEACIVPVNHIDLSPIHRVNLQSETHSPHHAVIYSLSHKNCAQPFVPKDMFHVKAKDIFELPEKNEPFTWSSLTRDDCVWSFTPAMISLHHPHICCLSTYITLWSEPWYLELGWQSNLGWVC